MFKKLLQIQIRHIVLVSIILLMVEVFSSSIYYYLSVKNTEDTQSLQILREINETRLSFLYVADVPSSEFNTYLQKVQAEFDHSSHIRISSSSLMPEHGYVVDEGVSTFPEDMIMHLQNSLIDNKALTVVTYIKSQNLWLAFHANTIAESNWKRAFLSLLVHLIIILILWTAFLLYYHYTLPREILEQISSTDGGRRTDSIISNLKKQIQCYYDEKNLMLAALAHDIRTPLTEAMLRLELMEDQQNISPIKENLTVISNIITSSLEYAKAPTTLKKIEVEIISLLESIIENYQDQYFHAELNTSLNECELRIEVQLFKRMIINILDNAKKYATHCEVTVTKMVNGAVRIECHDNGPGVPEEVVKKLAIPYFRVDKSRSSQTGGSGLGLAIVKKIAEIHNGSVEFKNYPVGGFSVILTLYDDDVS